MTKQTDRESAKQLPTLSAAARIWFRIGCLSFGGPAGQIALMHREVVEERNWLGERKFLTALNFCSLLPGPEAQQLATYLGWLMHGAVGGWIAGLFFILPGAVVMAGLSILYVTAGSVPVVAAFFFGLTCAVLAIVAEALLKVARRALHGYLSWALAVAAFLALFVLAVPFPLVIGGAALIGLALPRQFDGKGKSGGTNLPEGLLDQAMRRDPAIAAARASSARRSGVLALVLWGVVLGGALIFGGVAADVAAFFSKMALVTFGGAYAVLTYVAQEAVQNHAWLTADQMVAGLGLAETTPGPLILVLQFVGFLAGYGADGNLWRAGAMAALTLWVTFAPCFAMVFLGAPIIEKLHDRPRLTSALAAILAAVVGVIANLAIWFGIQVLTVDGAGVDLYALAITLIAAALLFSRKLGVIGVLLVSAALGYASTLMPATPFL